MPLSPGQRIGAYEIVSPLGAGGMGEVYRARDSKLKREVALKVLPADVANDRERLARFQREAEVLASLNHPHIAHVYGIEDNALVMELVEGEDLSRLIAGAGNREPGAGLPIDEALAIAKQIAEALEAAHDAGIIHRDLKPANVKVRPDGRVKVLDFGLAKALEQGTGSREPGAELANSPTITSPAMTMRGVILGTAAYMAPEQAKGKAVDRRADIWAFGCVFYEMLSGARAFAGEDVTDIITSVMRDTPDWNALPANTPPAIRMLIRRCLEKDPRKRVPHIAVAAQAIDDAMLGTGEFMASNSVPPTQIAPTAAASRWPTVAVAIVTALVVGGLASLVGWSARTPSSPPPLVRFQIVTPGAAALQSNYNRQLLAISPDGRSIVFAGDQLYLRSIADAAAHPIPGTQGFTSVTQPTFSPDGRSLVFWAASDRSLKRLSLDSNTVTTVCAMGEGGLGVSWSGDNIYFAEQGAGIFRVSPNGGQPQALIPNAEREEYYGTQLLPDGDTLLFTAGTSGMSSWDRANVVVQSLRTKTRKTIIEGATDPRYVKTGHLLYTRAGVLFAVGFDVATLSTRGEPIAMIEGVRRAAPGTTGAVQVSVSDAGTLAFMEGPVGLSGGSLQLAIFDRTGSSEPIGVPLGPYAHPRVSPDGASVAVDVDDGKEQQVWIYGLSKVSAARRLTFGGSNRSAEWTADGKRVAFLSTRDGGAGIWWQRADGTDTATQLTKPTSGATQIPQSFSEDGKHLLFDQISGAKVTLWDLSMADLKATQIATAESDVPTDATFSPDGHWFSYTIRPSTSQSIVYVEPYPPTGARYQLSSQSEDAHHAVWARDGKQLYYTPGPGNRFLSRPITSLAPFAFGDAVSIHRPFVNAPPTSERTYDSTRDGRILGMRMDVGPDGQPLPPQIQVVVNWFEDLKQRVPVTR